MLCDSEEVILSEERTTDEEKMKIIEGKGVQLSHASLISSTFFHSVKLQLRLLQLTTIFNQYFTERYLPNSSSSSSSLKFLEWPKQQRHHDDH